METVSKSLELLKTTVPSVRRVAVLSNPGNSGHALAVRSLQAAAQSLALDLQCSGGAQPNEFDRAFDAMTKERAEAVLMVADSLVVLHSARLADLTAKYRVPSMHGVREMVEAGA